MYTECLMSVPSKITKLSCVVFHKSIECSSWDTLYTYDAESNDLKLISPFFLCTKTFQVGISLFKKLHSF